MRSPEQPGNAPDLESLERDVSFEANQLFNEFLKNEYGVKEALTLLDTLDSKYVYHSKAHTLDVIRETILFAVAEKAPPDVIWQEAISAAWHDTGFVKGRPEGMSTEQYAMHLFTTSVTYEKLIKEGKNDVATTILRNIEDTEVRKDATGAPTLKKLHQETPGFVLDGDMSNFGRSDFLEKLELVAQELGHDTSDPLVQKESYRNTLTLMKNHSWRTDSARMFREAKKRENIETLSKMLAEL